MIITGMTKAVTAEVRDAVSYKRSKPNPDREGPKKLPEEMLSNLTPEG